MTDTEERVVAKASPGPTRALRVLDLSAHAMCLTRRARWRILLGGMAIAFGFLEIAEVLKSLQIVPGASDWSAFDLALPGVLAGVSCGLWLVARRPGLRGLARLIRFVVWASAIGLVVFGFFAALVGISLLANETGDTHETMQGNFIVWLVASATMVFVLFVARSLRANVRKVQESGLPWIEDSLASSAPVWSMQQRLAVAPWSDRLKFALYALGAYMAFAVAAAAFVGLDYLPEAESAWKSMETSHRLGQLPPLLALAGYFLLRRGRRVLARSSGRLVESDARAPVLLLRAWAADAVMIEGGPLIVRYTRSVAGNKRGQRLEETIADELNALGPVRAIGKPGEKLPELGAIREYVSDESWKARVYELMRRAAIIVVVLGQDDSAGIHWELSALYILGLSHKTLLIFPPFSAVKRKSSFKEFVARLLRRPPPQATGDGNQAMSYANRILETVNLDLAGAKPLAAIQGGSNESWVATIDSKQSSTEEAYRIALVTLVAQVGIRHAMVKRDGSGESMAAAPV